MMRSTLQDKTPAELAALAAAHGQPSYRGRQLAEGLYQQGARDLDDIMTLPKTWRARLREEVGWCGIGIAEHQLDATDTHKYLLELDDGARVEAVAIPRPDDKRTFCISSQVGCRMACVFCATGRMGLIRNLTAGEIVSQVLELRHRHPTRTHPNLVFMGMGEPLDNFDQLARALDILTHPEGLGLSARRITVSTSGVLEGIVRLQALNRPFGLAVSLTTGEEKQRRELMPIVGQVPLPDLLHTAADYGRHTHRKVTLECALIAGQNDTVASAQRLLEVARSGPFKVNVIPLNPIDQFDGARPDATTVDEFVSVLWKGGVVATVRDSAGREVDAACGQLLHRQRRRDLKS